MARTLFLLLLATLFNSSTQQASRIRLVGGSRPNEGRVEVRPVDSYNWGTICSHYSSPFGTYEGKVVCRMLGYPGAAAVRLSAYYYGLGSGNIYMDDTVCTGTESSLFDCSSSGWGIHSSSCTHTYDVGVLCFPSSNLGKGCRSVRFEGSFSAQHHRMTVFTMTGEFHGNRPVYKAGSDYLFYYPSDGSWHVGPYLGSAEVGMYVDDRSVYPEDISGTWYLLDTDGKRFVANRYVAVFCASSEGLTTFRIALGAFAAGLVIMLIIGICSCKVCCKKKGSVADSEHNTPPEGNSNTVEPPPPATPPPATPPPATPPPSTPPPAYSPPSLPEPDGSLFVRVVRLT
ncbi:PREDICTED: uncharacterized protein LOC109488234 [Branchiostoma belcheri]|uniref:Uncharacterized protein LOC109488234 n=1 Tax=Branchiostoma belcheri TaxID=7741 RepID=A0A6P5APE5_BRABE|nr:PREDICTED: uncharacterized protein LOC109488234 [Branchiostoma belcheri]